MTYQVPKILNFAIISPFSTLLFQNSILFLFTSYTEKAQQLKDQLTYVMYAHIAFWVVLIIFLNTLDGILELIAPLILWWGINQNSYWNMLIYMILNVFSGIMKLVGLIQVWSDVGFADSFVYMPLEMILVLFLLWFYITSVVVTYMAYKEFKACAVPYDQNDQEMGSIGGGYGGYQPPQINQQPQVNNVRPTGPAQGSYSAFRGSGVRVGGNS